MALHQIFLKLVKVEIAKLYPLDVPLISQLCVNKLLVCLAGHVRRYARVETIALRVSAVGTHVPP